MESSKLQSSDNVQDVLSKWPSAMGVFRAFKTDCVGCCLTRFCTLNEVAAAYEFELDPFLKSLSEIIQSCQRSNKNENL
jgi:hypothetical protein